MCISFISTRAAGVLRGNWRTGKIERTYSSDAAGHRQLELSADGRVLVANEIQEHSAVAWDTATGRILRSYKDKPNWVTRMTLSPDGKSLVREMSMLTSPAGERPTAIVGTGVWTDSMTRLVPTRELSGKASWTFCPAGRWVVSVTEPRSDVPVQPGQYTLRVHDTTRDWREQACYSDAACGGRVVISADGRRLIVTGHHLELFQPLRKQAIVQAHPVHPSIATRARASSVGGNGSVQLHTGDQQHGSFARWPYACR